MLNQRHLDSNPTPKFTYWTLDKSQPPGVTFKPKIISSFPWLLGIMHIKGQEIKMIHRDELPFFLLLSLLWDLETQLLSICPFSALPQERKPKPEPYSLLIQTQAGFKMQKLRGDRNDAGLGSEHLASSSTGHCVWVRSCIAIIFFHWLGVRCYLCTCWPLTLALSLLSSAQQFQGELRITGCSNLAMAVGSRDCNEGSLVRG